MTVAAGDIVRITAVMSYNHVSQLLNVFYTRHDGSGSIDDIDYVNGAASWLEAAWLEITGDINQYVFYEGVEAYNVTQDAPMLPTTWPTLVDGTNTVEAAPLQVAVLVNFKTAVKKSVGKKFIAGFSENVYESGGIVQPSTVATVDDWADEILAGFSVDTDSIGVGHVKALDGTFVPWLQHTVNPVAKTQRRRVLGVGA